jgi:hypothetical protein
MPDEQVTFMLDTLQKQVDALAEVAANLSNSIEPFTLGFQQKGLMDNIKLYAIIEYCGEVAKELSRIANVCEPQVAERITTRMIQEDMDKIEYSGYSYAPDTKQYINVTGENKPIILSWLKAHAHGRELVKEDFNANAFSAFIKWLKVSRSIRTSTYSRSLLSHVESCGVRMCEFPLSTIKGIAQEALLIIRDPTKLEERTDREVIKRLESIIKIVDDELGGEHG